MKLKLMIPLVLLLAAVALGQATTPAPTAEAILSGMPTIWAAGFTYNQAAGAAISQQVAFSAFAAKPQTASGLYAYVLVDVIPTQFKPITVVTDTSVGVAQKVGPSIAGWSFYATAAAGPSLSGSNVGWNWNAGGLATHPIKAGSKWSWAPAIRTVKSSINNSSGIAQSGYQLIFSLGVGTGG